VRVILFGEVAERGDFADHLPFDIRRQGVYARRHDGSTELLVEAHAERIIQFANAIARGDFGVRHVLLLTIDARGSCAEEMGGETRYIVHFVGKGAW